MTVGSVGVGIAVRAGAPVPAIRDEACLREHLLAADAVVFNRASTGLYMERLLDRLGLPSAMTRRRSIPGRRRGAAPDRSGSGREIAFAAATEIALFRERGVRFAGPLPDGLQNRTTYAAACSAAAAAAPRRNASSPSSAAPRPGQRWRETGVE